MRRMLTILVAGLLTVAGAVGPAAATTTRTPITGTGQVLGIDDPGREWFAGNIQHVRGRVLSTVQFVDDGRVGVGQTTVGFNLDTSTLRGQVWGTGTIDYGGGGYESTFSGFIRPDPSAPGGVVAEFRIVGHGFGDLAGSQIRGSATEFVVLGQQMFDGVEFSPGAG